MLITVWTTRMAKSRTPSSKLICPSRLTMRSTTEIATITGISIRTSCLLITSGMITAESPKINRTLTILLPTTLPTARSGCPFMTAPKVTANSGADVAAETITRPITSGEIPTRTARVEAPRTSASPPPTRSTRPAITKKMSTTFTAGVYINPSFSDFSVWLNLSRNERY